MKVCCFKSAFCGTTKNSFGDTRIDTSSCGGTSSLLDAVKGSRKPGNVTTIPSEETPVCAYSHLNIALAFIDPSSFMNTLMAQDK